jgi:hypothetical protein
LHKKKKKKMKWGREREAHLAGYNLNIANGFFNGS